MGDDEYACRPHAPFCLGVNNPSLEERSRSMFALTNTEDFNITRGLMRQTSIPQMSLRDAPGSKENSFPISDREPRRRPPPARP